MSSAILSVITILWFITAVFLSHQAGAATARTSGTLAGWCRNILEKLGLGGNLTAALIDDALRRSAHIIIFITLTALLCTSLFLLKRQHKWKIPPWAGLIFTLFFSWADEATKIRIDGRHFSWADVGLNAAGCLIGFLVYVLVRQIIRKFRKPIKQKQST